LKITTTPTYFAVRDPALQVREVGKEEEERDIREKRGRERREREGRKGRRS
jgi:hypothetical protein